MSPSPPPFPGGSGKGLCSAAGPRGQARAHDTGCASSGLPHGRLAAGGCEGGSRVCVCVGGWVGGFQILNCNLFLLKETRDLGDRLLCAVTAVGDLGSF